MLRCANLAIRREQPLDNKQWRNARIALYRWRVKNGLGIFTGEPVLDDEWLGSYEFTRAKHVRITYDRSWR